jgi:hypothetical protein
MVGRGAGGGGLVKALIMADAEDTPMPLVESPQPPEPGIFTWTGHSPGCNAAPEDHVVFHFDSDPMGRFVTRSTSPQGWTLRTEGYRYLVTCLSPHIKQEWNICTLSEDKNSHFILLCCKAWTSNPCEEDFMRDISS